MSKPCRAMVWHFCDDGVAQFRQPLYEHDTPFEITVHIKKQMHSEIGKGFSEKLGSCTIHFARLGIALVSKLRIVDMPSEFHLVTIDISIETTVREKSCVQTESDSNPEGISRRRSCTPISATPRLSSLYVYS